uniref:Integrin, alpha 1 n=1 Tax=Mastacembelus armatus TaxID=205130 RepID=A0A7N8XLD2_9TELE
MSFSGPLEDMFGYTVQQFENSEGKWVLIGSPLSGQPAHRTGDVYKCPVGKEDNTCIKLDLPKNTTVPNLHEVKENMTMGTTLVTNPNGGFLACGPQYGYMCGKQQYISGVCANVSSSFQILNSLAPAAQDCAKELDIVMVLDGSNSIYPWSDIINFLKRFIKNIDIGPKLTQVGIVSYGENVTHRVNLSQFDNTPDLLSFVGELPQQTGYKTMTFLAIETARREAFTPERGARHGVKKVMVVVTDGESHDLYNMKEVIGDCEKDDIERFGIAVLGDYNRQNKSPEDVQRFIREIESISSPLLQDHFFNVTDEAALLSIVDALGSKIFALEATTGNFTSSFEMEMSQAGFSAHTSKDAVLLGAVGAYNWNGTVVMQTAEGTVIPGRSDFYNPKSEVGYEGLAGYIGYDVQSATTPDGMLYITGAPRYNHTGRVVIYRLNEDNKIVVTQTLNGEQIGSYFGSVLQTIDVNGDSYTDLLLVGAPMYMGSERDEQGQVYVYKVNQFKHEFTLKPVNQSCCTDRSGKCTNKNEPCGARFGTAIAAVTDLNLDGFNDVAIGAPLENDHRGAVYIYHGDKTSLKQKFVQRIPAGGDGEKVKFFGQSIHGVMDLNGDGITDVTIGGLGGASLFWSRDVAELHANMTFDPVKINLQQSQCEYGGRKSVCVKTEVCFFYSIKSDNKDLTSARLDFRDPLMVSLEFGLVDEDKGPVLDESLPRSINKTIFASQLSTLTVLIYFSSMVIKARAKDKIDVTVNIRNSKDSAYNTKVILSFTPNINYVKVEPEMACILNHTKVECAVGYPFLGSNVEVCFILHSSFEVNSEHIQEVIQINVTATSDSEELASTLNDNTVHISIPVKYEAGLIFSVFVNTDLQTSVEKSGEIATPSLDLRVTYPHRSPRQNNLLYLTHVTTSPKVRLHVRHSHVSKQTEPPSYLIGPTSLQVKCDALECASFTCSLPEAKISQVNLTFRVWKPTFIKVKIQISKETLGGIPIWVIILSILIGLLILALVIFILWKVIFPAELFQILKAPCDHLDKKVNKHLSQNGEFFF